MRDDAPLPWRAEPEHVDSKGDLFPNTLWAVTYKSRYQDDKRFPVAVALSKSDAKAVSVAHESLELIRLFCETPGDERVLSLARSLLERAQ